MGPPVSPVQTWPPEQRTDRLSIGGNSRTTTPHSVHGLLTESKQEEGLQIPDFTPLWFYFLFGLRGISPERA